VGCTTGPRFPTGVANFSLRHRVQTVSGTHPTCYSMDTGGCLRGVKLSGREADNPPPASAEVKNAWSYISTPQYVLVPWCLVKHRD